MTVRVRIAPAPSGTLHIGNARTALYNWLFARSLGGSLILRIEDSDRARVREEYVEALMDELTWLGLDWDEGPRAGGPFAPYRQSERLATYGEAAARLESEGMAYKCFCTPEELDARRKQALGKGSRPGYDGRCYKLSDEQRKAYEAEGRRWVMRYHVRPEGETTFHDPITGPVTWQNREIDDFTILRQDGFPVYNFGVAVDDASMEVTHVIRGMDIQSSTPRQILVLKALGYPLPRYAHIPLVMGPGGKKLSKRFGGGSVEWYRQNGFLPEALVNSLVLLGTGFGDQTILSRDEMIAGFDLGKVNASPARFDLDKLDWMNNQYLKALPDDEFKIVVEPWLAAEGLLDSPPSSRQAQLAEALAPLIKDRIKRLTEAAHYARPVLDGVLTDSTSFEKVMLQEHVAAQMQKSLERLEALPNWTREGIEAALREVQTDMGLKPKTAFAPFYVSVTGSSVSAPIFDVMTLIGREECLRRLRAALQESKSRREGQQKTSGN